MRNGVFIIESNDIEDEKNDRFEGRILKEVLKLTEVKVKYFYIRTKLELKKVIEEFYESEYRYLHLACHANEKGVALTFENINLRSFNSLFKREFEGRRLFLSACSIGNGNIEEAFKNIGFKSISAFDDDVNFHDAAMFWATFYHQLYKNSKNNKAIKNIFENIADMYECYPNHYEFHKDIKEYKKTLDWQY